MAEYEALIVGVTTALSKGARNVTIQGDSRPIVQQMAGNFAVKEPALATYRTILQHLLGKFEQYKLKHILRTQNRYADALATMASKMAMENKDRQALTITNKSSPFLNVAPVTNEEWQNDIKEKLRKPKIADYKQVRNFALIGDVLYFKSSAGILGRCIDKEEPEKILKEIHKQSCGEDDPALVRRIQRTGYYWPNMTTDAARVMKECNRCRLHFHRHEIILQVEGADWRLPYTQYFDSGEAPTDTISFTKFKRCINKYCLVEGRLYRKSYSGSLLKCLGTEEAQEAMTEIRKGDCGEH